MDPAKRRLTASGIDTPHGADLNLARRYAVRERSLRLQSARALVAREAAALGYNTLLLEPETSLRADPYPVIKARAVAGNPTPGNEVRPRRTCSPTKLPPFGLILKNRIPLPGIFVCLPKRLQFCPRGALLQSRLGRRAVHADLPVCVVIASVHFASRQLHGQQGWSA